MAQREDIYYPSPETREHVREHMSSEAVRLGVIEESIKLYPYLEMDRSIIELHAERLWILFRRWVRPRFAAVKEWWQQLRAK